MPITEERQDSAVTDGELTGTTCPVCKSRATEDFFHLSRLPIHVGVVYDSAEEACRAEMGTITLSHCGNCGFVFNRSFEPGRMVFLPGYEVQLVHSNLFSQFLADLAARLVMKYHLHSKDVIDVGCGAGHFLRLLCEAGGNRGVGIDPTLSQEGTVPLSQGQMRLVRELFDEASWRRWECDFVTCQSVLEDVPDPVGFISGLRRLVTARNGQAYLEVFDAFRAFAAGEVWSLTYEQCNYFSLDSFGNAIRRAGFSIVDSGNCYGEGQYIFVEATPGRPTLTAASEAPQTRPAAIDRFALVHTQKLATWHRRVEEFRHNGTKAVVWGTGGKGVCFLNSIGAADVFTHALDINPNRQGRHAPGTGQPIIGPQQLPDLRPDVVVVTNPLYEAEIRQTVAELDLKCEFLTI